MNEEDRNDQFRAALCHFVERIGRGAQTKIAKKAGVRASMVNMLASGDRMGSEQTRVDVAAALGHEYEKFLEVGKSLILLEKTGAGLSVAKNPLDTGGEKSNKYGHLRDISLYSQSNLELIGGQPVGRQIGMDKTDLEGLNAFGIVVNEGMAPTIPLGATVIVDPDAAPENGRVVWDNRTKRFFRFHRHGDLVVLRRDDDPRFSEERESADDLVACLRLTVDLK